MPQTNRILKSKAERLPEIEVRVSPCGGRGAFALEEILKGTFVAPVTGTLTPRDRLVWSPDTYAMQIGEDLYMVGAGNADDFINHSCSANLGFNDDGQWFVALRDIAAGEELSFDYAMSENDLDFAMTCQCGAASCRGTVSAFRFLPRREQERFLPHAQPYLRALYKGFR
jgi:SET domain-containing protein